MRLGVTPCVPQDNRSLKEQNDELNGQIINLSIQGARSLFSTAFSESLAAEISSVSRDEVTAPPPRGPTPQVPHAARPPRGLQASAVQAPGTNPKFRVPPAPAHGRHSEAGRDQFPVARLHRQDHCGHHGDQPIHLGGQVAAGRLRPALLVSLAQREDTAEPGWGLTRGSRTASGWASPSDLPRFPPGREEGKQVTRSAVPRGHQVPCLVPSRPALPLDGTQAPEPWCQTWGEDRQARTVPARSSQALLCPPAFLGCLGRHPTGRGPLVQREAWGPAGHRAVPPATPWLH